MYLDWTTLVLLCLAGAIAWFWQDSLAAREIANAAAIDACEQLALQFLDGTVAFARLQLTRGPSGRLALRRTYVFDYTANSIERRQGFIVVSARRVETVGYAQDEGPRRESPRRAESGQIVQLEHWRARAPTSENVASDNDPPRPSQQGEPRE